MRKPVLRRRAAHRLVIGVGGRHEASPSDFDGEPWAAGDRIIFEDGTESRIVREPGEDFHVWSDPVPADLASVKRAVKVERAGSWRDLFSYFER